MNIFKNWNAYVGMQLYFLLGDDSNHDESTNKIYNCQEKYSW